MSDPAFNTTDLHGYIDRYRADDRGAADDLLRAVAGRLERLARKMLSGFPGVRTFVETGDVLQNALVRLLRSLREMKPESTKAFFNLAAVHIRRELLDLTRHFQRVRSATTAAPGPADGSSPAFEPASADPGPDDLDRWAAFHEAVEGLPAAEREVVGLAFYHGWTQPQIAELFGVDERTVRRRWHSACLTLSNLLGGQVPAL